ncbi:MAG: hypothetical protein ABI082_15620 [Dokdonella sp.]
MKRKLVTVLLTGALFASFAAMAQTGEGEGSSSFAPAMTPASGQTPDALTAGSAYYFVPASAFSRRSSIASTTYSGGGCITMNGPSSTDGALATDIQIPDGASIIGVRYFYANSTASNYVTVSITSFDGASGFNDIVLDASPAQAGFGDKYIALATAEVVDNFTKSYAIQAYPTGTPIFCGARVFYSTP